MSQKGGFIFSLDQPSYKLFRRAFAERKAPLVLICGSGLSASAGLPTWQRLRHCLEAEADAKERSMNEMARQLTTTKLNAAKAQSNMWVAFKLLKEYLTKPVFDNLIERELTPPDTESLPSAYSHLMQLNPSGLVTLNLDKFSGEALAKAQGSDLITPIYGHELARKWQLLRSSRTYLVYLHGALHDPSTWIMTQDDLDGILQSPGHAHFLSSVFNDNLVLFVGVSADDVALSKRLLDVTAAGFQPRNLYWFTSRLDIDTEKWASGAGVSLITYAANTNLDHSEAIQTLVDDCLGYIPKDKPEPPLVGTSKNIATEPVSIEEDPEKLAQELPEDVRTSISFLLDRKLKAAMTEEEVFKAYRSFCEEYDFAVDRSFYRGKAEKFRHWFGYALDGMPLGRGNFGEVYGAKDPDGKLVAVKIMHKNIFGNDDMLAGFRRGVRSMNIVTQASVPGMVPIIASFELPPTIVMPYVSGVSLEDAIRTRPDIPWLTKLDIAVAVGQTVGSAHALPQTVLHRDLKPSNIMINNMEWSGSFDPEITVLDFDMSWHKGSKEKDVVFESRDDFGYLAPEQTNASSRYAARSTRVDSYGFGMSIFYLFGGEPPRPNEALSERWLSRTTRAVRQEYTHDWKSAPNRLGRLVVRATQIDQNLRIDFASIVHELKYLREAMLRPNEMLNPELWAEEVMAVAAGDLPYHWDDATGRGALERPSGITIDIASNFRKSAVSLTVKYTDRGEKERSSVSKYLATIVTDLEKVFSDAGWTVSLGRVSGREAILTAEVLVDRLRLSQSLTLKAVNQLVSAFQF